MNKLRLVLVLALLAYLSYPQFVLADCYAVYSSADNAYTYARKGHNSDNLDDIHYYARKTMYAAEEAMSAAEICGCYDARSYAEDAYDHARSAYGSDDLDEALYHMRKAKSEVIGKLIVGGGPPGAGNGQHAEPLRRLPGAGSCGAPAWVGSFRLEASDRRAETRRTTDRQKAGTQ